MKHFTLYHGYIVDCAPDLRVRPSNAKIYAALDKGDEAGTGALALCAQANLAVEAIAALVGLLDPNVQPLFDAKAKGQEAIDKARDL